MAKVVISYCSPDRRIAGGHARRSATDEPDQPGRAGQPRSFGATRLDESLALRSCVRFRPHIGGRPERLAGAGRGIKRPNPILRNVVLLLSQFKSPIILLLLFAALLSVVLGEHVDAAMIFVIVFASGFLSFWQERGAHDAMQKLLQIVQVQVTCLRDGAPAEVPLGDVVPGDIVVLSAGKIAPGDCRVVEAKDLFVNEAALTGETFPVEKDAGVLPPDTPLGRRANCLFLGTSVVSGTAKAVVIHVGKDTEFGRISQSLKLRPPETEFEHGVRQFGSFLMEVTLVLVLAIFAINVFLSRPVINSFLFALALAVGLTPQLLPAIISVNLAHGAKRMAQKQVIVKRLSAIENFGSMDILCSDKTGTITEGVVKVHCHGRSRGSAQRQGGALCGLERHLPIGLYQPYRHGDLRAKGRGLVRL